MTTNNSNVINVPITLDGKELNITITINKTQSLTTETDKLEDIKLPFISKEEFELTFAEDNDEIRRLLLENINGKYKNNLELVEEKLNNIKDEQYKNETIYELFEVVKKSYNDENENENILLFLVKLMKEKQIAFYYKKKSPTLNPYESLYSEDNYKIMRLIFDNNICDLDNCSEFKYILHIINRNGIQLNQDEIYDFKYRALLKYNCVINESFVFEYDFIVKYYDVISKKLQLHQVCAIGGGSGDGSYEPLLNKLCNNNLSHIALRVLEEEEKHITEKTQEQYKSEYALKRALENNMVDVVFKMVQMRQKYEK